MRHRLLLPGVVVAGTAAFLFLADAASENDGPTTMDPRIAHTVVQDRSSAGTTVARLLTFLGSEAVLSIATLLVVIWLLGRRRVPSAVAVGVAMAGSAALTVGAKLAVGRPRPDAGLRLGPADRSYSFPSGHTLNSTVLLAMVAVIVVPLIARRSTRLAAWSVVTVLAVGIGASRIYLGYHWFTDVAGSWALATVWVALVIGALPHIDSLLRRSSPV
ncbi:phosphatase PAP2 family protein [Aeromicrobium endophyticum]|uniref:PAP2 family protein n=1 Tax=Aeromicrobium endophyticum TaxID=2292704 RepID=A0A371P3I6_9ACTN|nr:phosphatase PAP2 family protein [Aeromicrobium endophyticum]REK70492.1 PAP2 family protein [Aeromicrobium endophyticum]